MKRTKKPTVVHTTSSSSDTPIVSPPASASPGPSRGREIRHSKASTHPSPSRTESPLPLVNPFPNDFFRGHNFDTHFKTSIAHKQIVYEKSMDMFYYSNSPLKNLFESCGIASMISPPSTAYPKLVQQFYTNLEKNGNSYTSFVKGRSMFFTVLDLGNIMSVPSTGICPFTLKGASHTPFPPLEQLQIVMDDPTVSQLHTPKTVDVSPIACILHKLVRHNLLPRLGGGADFTYQDLVLVAMIMKGVSFNFSLMMLQQMMSCVRQTKKCLPYSGFLTKLFRHFHIPLENEDSISLNESIDFANLKLSRISLIDGKFVRTPFEIPLVLPPSNPPSSATSPSFPEVVSLLTKILTNQDELKHDISDIKARLSVLEKGKLPMGAADVNSLYNRVEDEFIDLQAGFELHTTAMVEALQQKMNRNACQLSQELKFVSHQVGTLGRFTTRRLNELGAEFHLAQIPSSIPEWPQCNRMAEFSGNFRDLEVPPETHIPRPPRFAHEMSLAEKIQRLVHRRYFTRRNQPHVNIVELD